MINKEETKNIAKKIEVPEKLMHLIVKEALEKTLKKLHGDNVKFIIDINTLQLTKLEKGQVVTVSLKDALGRKGIITLKLYLSNLLHEINPKEFQKKYDIDQELKELENMDNYISNIMKEDNAVDPHENFHWGGLSGEEAYIGWLNTE